MNIDRLFDDPARRRWWLLSKALEEAPLQEALRLAHAADSFLTGGRCELFHATEFGALARSGTGSVLDPSPDANTPAAPHSAPPARAATVPSREAATNDWASPDAASDDASEVERAADGGQALHPGVDAEREAEPNRLHEDADLGLAVLASVDEVVRYLRQQDDVVVSTRDGEFLVNGRFQEDLRGLLVRANRMRQRQGKPPFELFPNGFDRTREDAVRVG